MTQNLWSLPVKQGRLLWWWCGTHSGGGGRRRCFRRCGQVQRNAVQPGRCNAIGSSLPRQAMPGPSSLLSGRTTTPWTPFTVNTNNIRGVVSLGSKEIGVVASLHITNTLKLS